MGGLLVFSGEVMMYECFCLVVVVGVGGVVVVVKWDGWMDGYPDAEMPRLCFY